MVMTVETKQGPVEVEEDDYQRALNALEYGFSYIRQRSGLSHDAVMMACHIASRGDLSMTYAIFELLKVNELIAYQDTRDQVRYTRAGEFEPFHEKYEETRDRVLAKLERGYTVKYLASSSVHNRVLYDLIAQGRVNKVRNGVQAKQRDLLIHDDRDNS